MLLIIVVFQVSIMFVEPEKCLLKVTSEFDIL